MSGEPLSEELSPELESKLQETWNRVLVWKQCSPSEPSLKAILRAFAREILHDATQDFVEDLKVAEHEQEEAINIIVKERAALLASQKSETLLRAQVDLAVRQNLQAAVVIRASQESCRSLQKERDELAELIECDPGDSGTPCGNCRGCARSECRSLSEALENMLKDVEQPETVGYERAALKVLAPYRSSEAGRGKV